MNGAILPYDKKKKNAPDTERGENYLQNLHPFFLLFQ